MKLIQLLRAMSFVAPLGLFVSACYQEAPATDDMEEPQNEAESVDPNDATEADEVADPTMESTEAIETDSDADDLQCRHRGEWCRSDWECCSNNCRGGVCSGWRGECRHRGEWCRSDWECCSGNCYQGYCTGRWGH